MSIISKFFNWIGLSKSLNVRKITHEEHPETIHWLDGDIVEAPDFSYTTINVVYKLKLRYVNDDCTCVLQEEDGSLELYNIPDVKNISYNNRKLLDRTNLKHYDEFRKIMREEYNKLSID